MEMQERTPYKNRDAAVQQVLDVLHERNGHPIHAQQIGDRLCLSGAQVSDIVLELRSMGYLICGNDAYGGYWFGTLAEARSTAEEIRQHIKLEELAIHFMSKEEEKPEQMTMGI